MVALLKKKESICSLFIKGFMYTKEVFMKVFMSFYDSALDPNSALTLQDLKVYFSLCRNANWKNQIFKRQATLGKVLKIDQPKVSHSLKKLVEANLVIKKKDQDFGLYYELNPEFSSKGNVQENKNVVVRKRKVASKKIVPLKRVK